MRKDVKATGKREGGEEQRDERKRERKGRERRGEGRKEGAGASARAGFSQCDFGWLG